MVDYVCFHIAACVACLQQVGDGTTSVVLLAGEFLKQSKPYVEEGVHPQIIVRAFRKATHLVIIVHFPISVMQMCP